MTTAEALSLDRLVVELMSDCNRHRNGICSTVSCLRRSGWNGGKPDYSKSTCEKHEQAMALQKLLATAKAE